jgi:hypothetical protein
MANGKIDMSQPAAAVASAVAADSVQLCEVLGCGMPCDRSINGDGVYVCLHHRGWLDTKESRVLRAVKGVK